MGIVLFVLVSTANTSLQLWRGASEKIAVDREGRSGMALLAWDLENIVVPTWPLPRTVVTAGADSFPSLAGFSPLQQSNFAIFTNLMPRVQTAINDPGNTLRLAFLTLKPLDYQNNTNQDLGDICYVEYHFISNALWRGFASSSNTFAAISQSNRPPVIPPSSRELLATNLFKFKVWGHSAISQTIPLNNLGTPANFTNYWRFVRQDVVNLNGTNQTNRIFTHLPLAGIEYQMEVVDQKFMKMYKTNPQLAEAQGYKSRKYYQATAPVPSP
jgi:hypothetical protein